MAQYGDRHSAPTPPGDCRRHNSTTRTFPPSLPSLSFGCQAFRMITDCRPGASVEPTSCSCATTCAWVGCSEWHIFCGIYTHNRAEVVGECWRQFVLSSLPLIRIALCVRFREHVTPSRGSWICIDPGLVPRMINRAISVRHGLDAAIPKKPHHMMELAKTRRWTGCAIARLPTRAVSWRA